MSIPINITIGLANITIGLANITIGLANITIGLGVFVTVAIASITVTLRIPADFLKAWVLFKLASTG